MPVPTHSSGSGCKLLMHTDPPEVAWDKPIPAQPFPQSPPAHSPHTNLGQGKFMCNQFSFFCQPHIS